MVHIPEISGLTQAHSVDEVEEEARSYIAVALDIPQAEISLNVDVLR
jgi:hypothetical protein